MNDESHEEYEACSYFCVHLGISAITFGIRYSYEPNSPLHWLAPQSCFLLGPPDPEASLGIYTIK